MNTMQHPNFQRFAGAFFATASEQLFEFTPHQKRRVMRKLAAMKHHWLNADPYRQIRNAEEMAVRLARRKK